MTFNFDNTMLCDFAGCDASAIAKYVFGLRGKAEKIAADIGNVYHTALELHFQGRTKREVTLAFEEAYDRIIPPGEQPAEDRFGRKNCITIMERFCDVRPVEKMPWTVVETEVVRGMVLDDKGEFTFWVKRDILGQDKQSGAFVPIDNKTTGKLSSWWARKWRLTSQFSGYCWFTGQEFGQFVGDCYANAIEVGKLPDSSKRCATHGVKYSECYPQHANFQIYSYKRSQEQINRWWQDALIIAKQAKIIMSAFTDINMLPYAQRNGAFRDACVFCEFKEWCVNNFAPHLAGDYAIYDPWIEKLVAQGRVVTPGWRKEAGGR